MNASTKHGLPSLMTTREVADFVNVDPHTVYVWRRKGEGPPFVKIGGDGPRSRVRYRREDVRDWLNGRTRQITTTQGAAGARE